MPDPHLVALEYLPARYPTPPFHPSKGYPEYPFSSDHLALDVNPVYEAVRNSLYHLGLDAERFGTPDWNPLGDLMKPGQRVVIKPNFVLSHNALSDEEDYFRALVTQGAVLRPLVDYAYIAGGGTSHISIADSCFMVDRDFEGTCIKTGTRAMVDALNNLMSDDGKLDILDLRQFFTPDSSGGAEVRQALPGDPLGYVDIDLGADSLLSALEEHRDVYWGTDDPDATKRMHSDGHHRYTMSKTILDADLFICAPKLKVHSKVGVTLCMKNLVGMLGEKFCFPHYRFGNSNSGGDESPLVTALETARHRSATSLKKRSKLLWSMLRPFGRIARKLNRLLHSSNPKIRIKSGNWHGNETCWRGTHDLNRIILHADRDGVMHDAVQRSYLGVIDGVIGGEGNGPLQPEPVPSGIIIAGSDPRALDIAGAQLMGLVWQNIPLLASCSSNTKYPFTAVDDPALIRVVRRSPDDTVPLSNISPVHDFRPPPGWVGHVERSPREAGC